MFWARSQSSRTATMSEISQSLRGQNSKLYHYPLKGRVEQERLVLSFRETTKMTLRVPLTTSIPSKRDRARELRRNPRTPNASSGLCCEASDLVAGDFAGSIPSDRTSPTSFVQPPISSSSSIAASMARQINVTRTTRGHSGFNRGATKFFASGIPT